MSKAVVAILIVLLVLAAAGGYRYMQVSKYPIDHGRSQQSPNKEFVARATTFHDKTFWGDSHQWYCFELADAFTGEVLATKRVDIPAGASVCNFEREGKIDRAANSSAVTFGDGARQLCTLDATR